MYKKLFLSFGVIGSFTLYALHLKQEAVDHKVIPPSNLNSASPTASPIISGKGDDWTRPTVSAPANPSPTVSSSNTAGAYKDGSYTGSVEDVFYGNLQVKAIISGGKITDVQFLQYPNDRGTSIEINSQAMPYLKQEAIQAQSANVQIVSGATQSSGGFIRSLQNALDQAKV